jgi:large subunit ribosomal protein L9
MEVILLDDIEKLGLRGEVVNVARGYARNFLLPRRLAEPATASKVAELRKRDEQRARHEARSSDQAQQIADVLSKTVLRFEVKAGPTGSLFGSVTPTNIADELWRTEKIRVDRRKIGIDTIKRIGRFEVPIELFQDVQATVNTHVVPEGGELPSDEELAAMEAQERGEPEVQPTEEPAEPLLDEASPVEEPEPAEETDEAVAEPEAIADATPEPSPIAEAVQSEETAVQSEETAEQPEETEPPAPGAAEETA